MRERRTIAAETSGHAGAERAALVRLDSIAQDYVQADTFLGTPVYDHRYRLMVDHGLNQTWSQSGTKDTIAIYHAHSSYVYASQLPKSITPVRNPKGLALWRHDNQLPAGYQYAGNVAVCRTPCVAERILNLKYSSHLHFQCARA